MSQETFSISEIRTLVGLPSTDPSQEKESVPIDSSIAVADSPNALIDAEDFEEEGPTQKKLWQRPLPKLIAITVPVGIIFLVLGFLLVNFSKFRLAEDESESTNTTEEVSTVDPETTKDEEIARLKTSNALGNQATVLNSQAARRTELNPTYREKFTTTRPEAETRETPAMRRQPTTVAPASVRSRPAPSLGQRQHLHLQ